jgi:hypothetical protein
VSFYSYTFFRAFVTAYACLRLMGCVLFLLGAVWWCQPPITLAWYLGLIAIACAIWWLLECLQYFNHVCDAQVWEQWREDRGRVAQEEIDQAMFDAMQHVGQ